MAGRPTSAKVREEAIETWDEFVGDICAHRHRNYNEQVALEAVKQAFQLPGEAREVETHETARATDYINYTW